MYKKDSRAYKVLKNVDKDSAESQNLGVLSARNISNIHIPNEMEAHIANDINDCHSNDSFVTNSIPDSQNNLDLSLLDDTTIDNNKSDSESTNSDSSSSTDFSSDDSVKDPNYQDDEISSDTSSVHIPPPVVDTTITSVDAFPTGIDDSTTTRQTFVDVLPTAVDDCTPSVNHSLQNIDAPSPSIDVLSAFISTTPASDDTSPPLEALPNSVDSQPPSVSTEPPSVVTFDTVNVPRKSRKRKANPESWKRNISKVLKNSGQAYTSMSKSKKVFEEKKMGPVCSQKCKLKCHSEFSTEDRTTIFEGYYKMGDLLAQRQFIQSNMTKIQPKYRYIREGSQRKNFNHAYYLPRNNSRIRVCKVFFMNTLAISDKAIRTVVSKTCSHMGIQLNDNRGRHGKQKKLDLSLINGVKAHINSIPRIESHYCRAQSQREYIEGGYSISSLHRDYVDDCKSKGLQHVTYQIYYNVFVNDFNISFWQPKKDQCEDCTAYENAEDKENLQAKYDVHLNEKVLSRNEKEKDKANVSANYVVAVYDLQAVMPCPKGEVSSFYYVSKLNVLNFTITELGSKNTTCFVWHEGEGARGVNEIGSCVLMYLDNLNENATEDIQVTFYSDNCCGQQKNKFMLAMYQYALQKYPKIKSITHKFLIKGHTQNEGDCVHSVIQRNISRALKSAPIYIPDQYITLIRTAKKSGNPYCVKELTHKSFTDLKSLAVGNYSSTIDKEKVKWADIKILKVCQEHKYSFFFKTSYGDEEFKSVSTLKKRQSKSQASTHTLKPLYLHKLEVSQVKKTGILDLIRKKNVIPQYYESFYANL